MTNPKHTSSDLVEWCSQDLPCARYQALEAENERLREALKRIQHFSPAHMWRAPDIQAIARAALDTRHD